MDNWNGYLKGKVDWFEKCGDEFIKKMQNKLLKPLNCRLA
jgi:hypothetical protein